MRCIGNRQAVNRIGVGRVLSINPRAGILSPVKNMYAPQAFDPLWSPTLFGSELLAVPFISRREGGLRLSRQVVWLPEGEGPFPLILIVHGNHSMEDCHTLKAQAKRMKATYEAQTPENRQKLKNRQELHAIIAESVEEALKKKKFTPLEKKQKAEADLKQFEKLSISGTEESDSSSSEDE